MSAPAFHKKEQELPVIKTVATEKKGIHELMAAITGHQRQNQNKEKNVLLLTDKAWQLLVHKRMKAINKIQLKQRIEEELKNKNFNLYSFVENYV